MSSKGKGKDKGKGNNKGSHHPPSQSGTAGPAPSPSGPIAGPSHYATRRSRRLNPDMAPPSASALGAEHASLTADSDNPDHAFTPPITPYIALTYLIVDDRFNPLENIFAVRELSTHLIADVMESIIAKSTALGDVRASSLVLWKLLEPLPLDISGEASGLSQLLEILRSNPKSVAQRLSPALLVVTCFNNESLRENHLHLLVQAPIFRDNETTGAKKRKRNLAGDIADFRDGED